MEYGSSRVKETKFNGNQVFEKYMWMMCMNQVKNEEIFRRIGFERIG